MDVNFDVEIWKKIPPHIQAGLRAYVVHRRAQGHFLSAVLRNDLRSAFWNADDASVESLAFIVRWLHNYAPAVCWGSPERVRGWLEGRPVDRTRTWRRDQS